jgi:LmbE family N-acetylglucosaminyl deacetylase
MTYTVVSFHAHPDDEVLLTGGTLAKAAADGHRVVVAVATRGERGLSTSELAPDLGASRSSELERSAVALGCARVVCLGYADSGMHNEYRGFAAAPVEDAATQLADLLREEAADVLTVYDSRGGYGHPDHVQLHRVGHRAAEMAGTPVVLEATVDRTALLRALTLVSWTRLLPAAFSPARLRQAYSPRQQITHRIDVRRQLRGKHAAMAAHASQATGGSDVRTLAVLLKLPRPLYRLVCGTEWFIERGRAPDQVPVDDIFASLRNCENLH